MQHLKSCKFLEYRYAHFDVDSSNRREKEGKSPLLMLPDEIRERILTRLVGGQLIHIGHTEAIGREFLVFFRSEPEVVPDKAHFRHMLCQADKSESEAYEEARRGYAQIPANETREYYIETCCNRHKNCAILGANTELCESYRLNLGIMGTCRQLYSESYFHLWIQSTFSFSDPDTFKIFSEMLNDTQLKSLANLHFVTPMFSPIAPCSHSEGFNYGTWEVAFRPEILKKLTGLKTLHISFDQRLNGQREKKYRRKEGLGPHDTLKVQNIGAFVICDNIPQKKAMVIVSDDPEWNQIMKPTPVRWSAAVKNHYAELFEARIMVSDPEDALAADLKDQRAEKHRINAYKKSLFRQRREFRYLKKQSGLTVATARLLTNPNAAESAFMEAEMSAYEEITRDARLKKDCEDFRSKCSVPSDRYDWARNSVLPNFPVPEHDFM